MSGFRNSYSNGNFRLSRPPNKFTNLEIRTSEADADTGIEDDFIMASSPIEGMEEQQRTLLSPGGDFNAETTSTPIRSIKDRIAQFNTGMPKLDLDENENNVVSERPKWNKRSKSPRLAEEPQQVEVKNDPPSPATAASIKNRVPGSYEFRFTRALPKPAWQQPLKIKQEDLNVTQDDTEDEQNDLNDLNEDEIDSDDFDEVERHLEEKEQSQQQPRHLGNRLANAYSRSHPFRTSSSASDHSSEADMAPRASRRTYVPGHSPNRSYANTYANTGHGNVASDNQVHSGINSQQLSHLRGSNQQRRNSAGYGTDSIDVASTASYPSDDDEVNAISANAIALSERASTDSGIYSGFYNDRPSSAPAWKANVTDLDSYPFTKNPPSRVNPLYSGSSPGESTTPEMSPLHRDSQSSRDRSTSSDRPITPSNYNRSTNSALSPDRVVTPGRFMFRSTQPTYGVYGNERSVTPASYNTDRVAPGYYQDRSSSNTQNQVSYAKRDYAAEYSKDYANKDYKNKDYSSSSNKDYANTDYTKEYTSPDYNNRSVPGITISDGSDQYNSNRSITPGPYGGGIYSNRSGSSSDGPAVQGIYGSARSVNREHNYSDSYRPRTPNSSGPRTPNKLHSPSRHDFSSASDDVFSDRSRSPQPSPTASPTRYATFPRKQQQQADRSKSPGADRYGTYTKNNQSRTKSPGPSTDTYGTYTKNQSRAKSPGPSDRYGTYTKKTQDRAKSPGPRSSYGSYGGRRSPGPGAPLSVFSPRSDDDDSEVTTSSRVTFKDQHNTSTSDSDASYAHRPSPKDQFKEKTRELQQIKENIDDSRYRIKLKRHVPGGASLSTPMESYAMRSLSKSMTDITRMVASSKSLDALNYNEAPHYSSTHSLSPLKPYEDPDTLTFDTMTLNSSFTLTNPQGQSWIPPPISRQNKLDEALLSSGRFSDALASLLEWLGKAEAYLSEDQPILGDLDTVNILIEQHKAFQQELESRQTVVQVIKQSPAMDHSLAMQLEELNSVWDRVNRLTDVRETRLQEALKLAEDFNEAVQVVREWLPQAESTLKFRALPDDEDAIVTLMESHDRFQDDLRGYQPNVERIKFLAEEILQACHPNAVRFVKYYLTITQTRWEQAVNRSNQRSERLHEALRNIRGNAALLEELLAWLTEAQALLSTKEKDPIPEDLTVVEALSKEHMEFHDDLTQKNKDVERLTKMTSARDKKVQFGSQYKLNETDSPSQRVTTLQNRWRNVWRMSVDRKKRLQDSLDNLLELESFKNFDFDLWRQRYNAWIRAKKLRITDFFRRQDKNGDGSLTRDEFVNGMLISKFPTNRTELNAVFDIFDRNKSGELDYREFVDALRPERQRASRARAVGKRPVSDNELIHDEIEQQVARCQCRRQFKIQKIDNGKYKFPTGFGDKQKICLVRFLNNTVMVRVGGGWVTLAEFLDQNDPCKADVSKSRPPIFKRPEVVRENGEKAEAKGRTNTELREQFFLPEGVSQSRATFTPKQQQHRRGSTPNVSSNGHTPRSNTSSVNNSPSASMYKSTGLSGSSTSLASDRSAASSRGSRGGGLAGKRRNKLAASWSNLATQPLSLARTEKSGSMSNLSTGRRHSTAAATHSSTESTSSTPRGRKGSHGFNSSSPRMPGTPKTPQNGTKSRLSTATNGRGAANQQQPKSPSTARKTPTTPSKKASHSSTGSTTPRK